MTPTDHEQLLAAIHAATQHDHRTAPMQFLSRWSRVPDDQVARLIEGLIKHGYVLLAEPHRRELADAQAAIARVRTVADTWQPGQYVGGFDPIWETLEACRDEILAALEPRP